MFERWLVRPNFYKEYVFFHIEEVINDCMHSFDSEPLVSSPKKNVKMFVEKVVIQII